MSDSRSSQKSGNLASRAPARSRQSGLECIARRDGRYWALSYDGTTVRVRDNRGTRHLIDLLLHPGRLTDVIDLFGAPASLPATDLPTRRERARKAVTNRIRERIRELESLHPALGLRLREGVCTGTYCRYDPVEGETWVLQ